MHSTKDRPSFSCPSPAPVPSFPPPPKPVRDHGSRRRAWLCLGAILLLLLMCATIIITAHVYFHEFGGQGWLKIKEGGATLTVETPMVYLPLRKIATVSDIAGRRSPMEVPYYACGDQQQSCEAYNQPVSTPVRTSRCISRRILGYLLSRQNDLLPNHPHAIEDILLQFERNRVSMWCLLDCLTSLPTFLLRMPGRRRWRMLSTRHSVLAQRLHTDFRPFNYRLSNDECSQHCHCDRSARSYSNDHERGRGRKEWSREERFGGSHTVLALFMYIILGVSRGFDGISVKGVIGSLRKGALGLARQQQSVFGVRRVRHFAEQCMEACV